MAPATDAEPRRVARGCTSDHSAEMTPSYQAELEFRHGGQLPLPPLAVPAIVMGPCSPHWQGGANFNAHTREREAGLEGCGGVFYPGLYLEATLAQP